LNKSFLLSPEAAASTEVKSGMCCRKNQARHIIFGFGFHCKRIVAIFMGWRKAVFSEQKTCSEQQLGHRK
jgi:hypothetical protein